MKKTLAIVLIIITFLIIYFLQANFFTWFNIAGIKPNLFVVLILLVGLFAGRKIGIPIAIFLGFFLDLVVGKSIGISAFMFAIVAFFGGYLDKNFSKDSRLTIMLMVAGSTAIYEIGSYVFNVINLSAYAELGSFIKILLIEIVYNAMLTIILYPLIQKTGYKLEEIFKENKILTRYF